MNFENLGDRIIDDQGNVKTIASAQDARLYYLDFEGNRKKYLLEGEGGGGEEIDLSDFSTDTNISLKTSENIELSGFILKWKQYRGKNGIRGIDFSEADFFDMPFYTRWDNRDFYEIVKSVFPERTEFTDGNEIYMHANHIYYMPKYYDLDYLNISNIDNNSMIFFNTNPDNEFSYSIYFDYSNWLISKPFDFKKGKSYCITAFANCVFWCEVQYND